MDGGLLCWAVMSTLLAVPPATEAVTEAGGMQLIKRTYQPSVVRRKRTHGFLSRLATRDGRKVLERRRRKGRARLAV